jgi:hypothetical protein
VRFSPRFHVSSTSLELRVEHGGELIESRLSRHGTEPLLLIADQIRTKPSLCFAVLR